MKKLFSVLLVLFLSASAFTECVNFAGRWTNVKCDYYGPFENFEYIYPFMDIKQTGCENVEFGPGESVSEIGKSLTLGDLLKEINAKGTIEAKWLDVSQQALELVRDIVFQDPQRWSREIRTSKYEIKDGKLIMDITRNDSGYRWQSLNSARCIYSHRE